MRCDVRRWLLTDRQDTFMSKTARLYRDTRTATGAGNLDKLNDDLQDVTRIMTKNMEELLWRGDSLDRACLLHRLVCLADAVLQECHTSRRTYEWTRKSTAAPPGM